MSFGASQLDSLLSSIGKMLSGTEIQQTLSESLAQIGPLFNGANSRPNAINIYETVENIVVEIQVPGFNKNQLRLWVEGQNLMMSCERRSDDENSQPRYYRNEFSNEDYTRSISLPINTDTSKVQASMTQGILMVKFAKLSEAEKIEIIIE